MAAVPPIVNTIAQEDIDGTLVFRFMKPLYSWWKDIGIYQRNLTNYDTSVGSARPVVWRAGA